MSKTSCTAGVYLIVGEKGVRIGQSACMETRVPRVRQELQQCIGKPKRVLQIPVVGKKERRALERDLIKALNPRCNIIGRVRRGKKLS